MTLSWGIIGCGDVAEHKGGPALYRVGGSELVAVMRRRGDLAADFAKRHGAKRHYDKVEDLIADPEVNAVYVATPPNVHSEQTIMAARGGKHVLCEKPMAMNSEEAGDMIAACREAGVQLMIAYYRRRFDAVLKIKELIDSGSIGRPIKARLEVDSRYEAPVEEKAVWRFDPAIGGGGLLMDVGSHGIDLLHFWLGNVRETAAFIATVEHDIEVENSSSLILAFENSVQAVVTVNQNVDRSRSTLEVTGTEGRIALIGGLACRGVVFESDKGEKTFDLPPTDITHFGIVEDLVEAVRSGRENCVPGEEGVKTTKVLDAASRASARRCVVNV